VGSTLLASSGVNLLLEKKQFLSSSFNENDLFFETFNENDLGKASFVLGIRTYRDKGKGVLELSQVYT
jgi:hypothetical protein